MKRNKIIEPSIYRCQECERETPVSSNKVSVKCYCSGLMFKLTPMELLMRGEE